ncbi:INO80 complex subunit C [Lamellibrachia satsuma]|nr:INO80 complex subunit C [Lamellibrachia satsuma]
MASTGKRRASSKQSPSPGNGNQSKKTAKNRPTTPQMAVPLLSELPDVEKPSSKQLAVVVEPEVKEMIFKDSSFVHSCRGVATNKKMRVWKNLRQIIAAERVLPWKTDDATYSSIEAPPSFKPAKKYSDITGLPAKYTDPQTKIRYASTEEFSRIRMLPSDITAGYLALRKANIPVP